jgi:D-3-phosphoglycerate dehydrogenase
MTESRYTVLVTDVLAPEGLAILEAHPRIEPVVKTGLAPEDLVRAVGPAHGLLVRSGTKVTAALLEAAPRLSVVGRAGTGVDNIDVDAATRRGVVVMNTPGGNAVAACEHTFALILALFRNIGPAGRELAGGVWNRKKHMGHQLLGKTLGLVGFGRIGREVARRARAFGMDVAVFDPFVTESLAREFDCRLASLDALLAEADVVSLHLPLNEQTRHLIDAAALARMRPEAVLVNCARGGLVDEEALLEALDAGRLCGAALDVFESEPPENLELLAHARVVATPHLGASTEEAQRDVAAQVARQVVDYLVHGEVRNAVNVPSLSADVYAKVRPHVELSRRLGSLAAQLAETGFERITVRFRGDYADLPRSPVVSAALVGVLGTVPGGGAANYVNARLMAAELGIVVEETAAAESGDHPGLLEIVLAGSDAACTVAGRVTHGGAPRLARWDGLGLDAPPAGTMLAARNPDVPGVVGAIGGLLGEAGVNIAHISWGRNRDTGEALTLINVDGDVPEAVLESIRAHDKVRWARLVRLS